MKGTIRANLGASRYTVGIPYAEEPLKSLKADAQAAYEDAITKRLEALKALAAAREPYDAILTEIEWASASYDACRIEFDYSSRLAAARALCDAAYSDCYHACNPIEGESKPAEEIFACQKQCAAVRDACYEQAALDTKNLEIEHLTKCQSDWGPVIADLQKQALALLPPVQEAMYQLETAEAAELAATLRVNELAQVQANEQQITCFKAQYDDALVTGTEVEVARTPAGRHVITEIYPTTDERCLQEARVLPSKHLFNNAALYPGFETWRPTWRVGVVKAIQGDKLEVEIKSGTMTGSLGTLYSRNPINCTPPQAYFDGDWQTKEAQIRAARESLADAQEAKAAAVAARDDCIAGYGPTWVTACYTTAAGVCNSTWASWLAECEALEGIDPAECMAQYEASLAACYENAQYECLQARDAGIEACRAEWQPGVDAAAAVVTQATDALQTQLSGLYQPAEPLVLTIPVAHCAPGRYEVADEVLVDFPVRAGDAAMEVWDSARVVGWASETRSCYEDILLRYSGDDYMLGCGGEIQKLSYDLPYKDYWSGTVGTAETMLYWGANAIWQRSGWLADATGTVACAALKQIEAEEDGKTVTKTILLYAVEKPNPPGLNLYARDVSDQEAEDIHIVTLDYPAPHYDDMFDTAWMFSPDATQIGVLNIAVSGDRVGFTSGYRGKIYLGTLPAYSLTQVAPVVGSLTVSAEGDDALAELVNGSNRRNFILGAKWNGNILEPYNVGLEAIISNVNHQEDPERVTYDPPSPNPEGPGSIVSISDSESAVSSSRIYVTPDGHGEITIKNYEGTSNNSFSLSLLEDTSIIANQTDSSFSRSTIKVFGFIHLGRFDQPLIYYSQDAYQVSNYSSSKSGIISDLQNSEAETLTFELFYELKAIAFILWAYVCDLPPEVWHWYEDCTISDSGTTYVNKPIIEFFCGATGKAGEIEMETGEQTDQQIFNWYNNRVTNLSIGDNLLLGEYNTRYVTQPCPAAQIVIGVQFPDIVVTEPTLMAGGDTVDVSGHEALKSTCEAMVPLRATP